MTMPGVAGIDRAEIERRKERVRRAWAYRAVDHIPLGFFCEDYSRYSLREQCLDGAKQFEVGVACVERLLRLLPDDYIPALRVWPGYITIATMFGLQPHWVDDPAQPPGVLEHPITDMAQVESLCARGVPDPRSAGLMPFNLRWLRHAAHRLPPEVSLTGMDLGGPVNTAKDLLETNLLYTAFYDSPKEYHRLLAFAAEVQIGCYREVVAAAGGLQRLTCIDFGPLWAPEGAKGFVSDDVCASFSPQTFREFSRPHNNRIFRLWPGGRLHNCGPHPSLGLYLDHDPPINGLNCSFRYTRAELPRIREAFRGRGLVEFMFDNGEGAEEILRGYEEIAEALCPEVVGIPLVWLNETWSDQAIRGLHDDLRVIAERYAQQMRWRNEE